MEDSRVAEYAACQFPYKNKNSNLQAKQLGTTATAHGARTFIFNLTATHSVLTKERFTDRGSLPLPRAHLLHCRVTAAFQTQHAFVKAFQRFPKVQFFEQRIEKIRH